MKVLVACEFSGVVREAFRKKGHDAWSCDLIDAEDHNQHHYMNDIREVLRRTRQQFDMMIAFPPCTHLCVSGGRWFKDRKHEQEEALRFVSYLMNYSGIERIAIENPIGVISTRIRKPDQIIQPWMFGHGETKATCLWLKNLPKLEPTKIVNEREQRILTIRNPKTRKHGIQKTSIMPYDIEGLSKFLEPFKDDERIFPTTRSTAWRYYKNASILGGMKIFEAKEQINIDGAWTHLLRSSCAKLYEDTGAKFSLIQCKLRHSFGGNRNATDRYVKRDLPSLIEFDEKHFSVCPAVIRPLDTILIRN